jgi:ABC-type multidrug transport system fused ATPase/permease subunit
MLFKVLQLFGLDVRAEIAAVKGQIEQRVDEVADRAKHAALTAAVIIALATFAGLFCTLAMGVGLIALYRAEAAIYGVDIALAIVAAVLVVAALILLGVALMAGKSLSRARASKAAENVARSAAAAFAPAAPEAVASPPAASAGDLTEPLAFLLALFARDAKLGHPVLDEFAASLRTPAGGKADEAVEQALDLIRNGDRTQLLVMLGGAALAGWLLARSRPDTGPRDAGPPI